MTTKVDTSFMTLRRIDMASERMETLHAALYMALLVSFVAVLYALYTVREDILKAIEKGRMP